MKTESSIVVTVTQLDPLSVEYSKTIEPHPSGGALNAGGATGYGVRLLNKFIEENYE